MTLAAPFSPTVAIVTALAKEYAAVEAMLDDAEVQVVSGRRYTTGTMPGAQGKHRMVLVRLPAMGNNPSAVATSLLLTDFPGVREVVMVGIAAAIPNPSNSERHVRLGDVVLASSVCQYDMVKREDERLTPRGSTRPSSARLTQAHAVLETARLREKPEWHRHIQRCQTQPNARRPEASADKLRVTPPDQGFVAHPPDADRVEGEPRVFMGVIASGNQLLKDALERDRIRDAHGALALEMEGSGVADACWASGCGYGVIRGTCDYGDSDKNDQWQGHAAVIAAAYLKGLLEVMPPIPPMIGNVYPERPDATSLARRIKVCVASNSKLFRYHVLLAIACGTVFLFVALTLGALLGQDPSVMTLLASTGFLAGATATWLAFTFRGNVLWYQQRIAGGHALVVEFGALRDGLPSDGLLEEAISFLKRCAERCLHG
jgi:nucleoside phosphorylase